MTIHKMINDPDALITELIEGMVSAHPHLLRTEGETGRAIVAVNGPRPGKVGIVIGGGSGHEPAFAGYVGRGLADAAPLGNIFASPSPSQIMDAAFAADGGAGVLFLYGNYTGDVMNFDMASDRLKDHGIAARSFVVTDDVASAPKDKAHERRGIAGDFFVMAATLMEIKSRLLLPKQRRAVSEDSDEEDDIDPRWELVHQLLEYKKFKEAADTISKLSDRAALFKERDYASVNKEETPARPLKPEDKNSVWNAYNIVLRRLIPLVKIRLLSASGQDQQA